MVDSSPAANDVRRARRRVLRRLLLATMLVLLLLLLVRALAIQGWVFPVRVTGGSMAESLHGAHYLIACDDCRFPFRCGTEYLPESQMAVCPNCGFPRNRIATATAVSGDRVFIDRGAHWFHAPRMWAPIAFRSDQRPEFFAVKRVVAHDRGRVTIRDGDVFVDGKIQRKTLDQFRRLRILVHDDRYRPPKDDALPRRWRSSRTDSAWNATSTGYCYNVLQREPNREVDWLEYSQWTCWPNPSPPVTRTTRAPIVDYYAYNQNVARGPLNRVDDIVLECTVTVAGRGSLMLRTDNGLDDFRLAIVYPNTTYRLERNGNVIRSGTRPFPPQPWTIEFGVCDQRVLVAINGDNVAEFAFEPRDGQRRQPASAFSIGAIGLEVKLDHPRIFRDIYYFGPAGETRWTSPHKLAPQQWFLLGDNVPVSIDSRQVGPVDADSILGSVYRLTKGG